MSIYVSFDGDDGDQFASNTGWGDICRWAEELEGFPEIDKFATDGISEKPGALREQFAKALADNSPEKETVTDTVKSLIGILDANKKAEVVTINNGMGPSDDGEQ